MTVAERAPQRRGVVLVHGFGGSTATFGDLPARLTADGIVVEAASWRAADASWDVWIDAVDAAVAKVAAAAGGVVVVGQSAGAALAVAAATGRPDAVEAVVALNPLVHAMDADTIEFLEGRLGRGHATLPDISAALLDPDAVDPDRTELLDLAGLLELHRNLPAVARRWGTVRAAITVVRGRDDEVLGPEHAAAIIDAGGDARLVEVGGGHLAALDLGRDDVARRVADSTIVAPREEPGGPTRRSWPARLLAVLVIAAIVGGSVFFAARAVMLFLETRAEAEAFRRLGTCDVLDPAVGSVTCSGVELASVRLPTTFAVCRRWQEQGRDCLAEVHVRARPAFADAIGRIDAEGLGDLVTEFGTVKRRMCRDAISGAWRDGCISRHSYGIAVDVRDFGDNARWAELVAAEPRLERLVEVFEGAGFRWGGDFRSNVDPQHFEWKPR